jgi:hypothetical protein
MGLNFRITHPNKHGLTCIFRPIGPVEGQAALSIRITWLLGSKGFIGFKACGS